MRENEGNLSMVCVASTNWNLLKGACPTHVGVVWREGLVAIRKDLGQRSGLRIEDFGPRLGWDVGRGQAAALEPLPIEPGEERVLLELLVRRLARP